MKRRVWSVLVMVALILTMLPAKVARAEETEGNFTYKIMDGEIMITGFSEAGKEATELVIPEEINGLPVTIINSSAFEPCNTITSLHIPASVIHIGNQALSALSGLTKFTVAEENEVYTAIDGILYSKDLTVLHVATTAYPSDVYEVPTTVKRIDDHAFASNQKITNVTIYENVTAIGSGAFLHSGIGSLYIPKSVTEIGDSAFTRMANLTEFYLDGENPSFTYVNGLLTTKDGTRILDQVMNKDSLTEFVVPEEVTTIDPNAFYGCPNLAKVTIPASVTSIGYLVCYECAENLVLVVTEGSAAEEYANENNIPVQYIHAEPTEGIFTYKEADGKIIITGLSEAGAEPTELVIPEEINGLPVTEIANYAFSNNQNIVKVTLPDTLKVIGDGAFEHCFGLTTINLPEGLERIGGGALAICTSLTSLHIPASVTSIGSQAFNMLHGLTELTVAEDNEVYTAIDGILYSKDLTVLHVATTAYPSDVYEVPTTINRIDDHAFVNNQKITNVTIYENVTAIGSGAFGGSGVRSLYIPKSVTEIGDSAFIRMANLTEFYLDGENPSFTYVNGLLTTKDGTRILDQVMNKDSLTEFVVPEEVTTIDPNAFYGCPNLAKVTIPASVTSIGYLVCYECAENLVFVVTEGSAAEAYAKENNFAYEYEATQKDSEWKKYYSWSEVEGGVRLNGLTEEAYALTELVIPTVIEGKKVVELAPGIFSGLTQLESLACEEVNDYYVVENGVVYTADYKVLHSVTAAYPESFYEVKWGVEEIGAMAFRGCDLPVIRLNNQVTTIGSKAFAQSTVTSIYLPENVQYIAEGAFYGLHHLDYTTQFVAFSVDSNNPYFEINNGRLISKDGTRILLQTHDKDLTSATLSGKVTTIDDWAFLGCENLTEIKIPASVTYIGKKAFADCIDLVITTPAGSYAAEYAAEQGIACEEMDPSGGAEGVAVNEENFPDDIFRAYISDSFDTDWNGVLSEEEIAAATVIDCMHVGIKDITGIEYLTELVDLRISMNEVWIMDLSNNTKLQNIGVSYQEPSTGEIKGEIGQEGTAFLTEFTFPYENLFDYEDQLGAAGLYVKVALPEQIYNTPEEVYWYYRRESFGYGGDLSMQDADGNYYYQLDVRDSADYLYVGTAAAGVWSMEEAVVDLASLSEEYYIELVTFDEFTTEWTEENGGLVTAEPVALEGTKVFFKDIPVKVETKVTNEYTVDFRQIVGEENIDKVKTVENGYRNNRVEVVDGVATFYPLNFGVHQISPQLCASYEYDTGLNGYTVYVNFRFERLVSVEDCEEVPEGLGDQFESVDDLREHMHKEMHKGDKKQHKHQEIYDAKLWDINENCEWYNIAPEDFPREGVEVFIPYPTGTDRDTDFKIAHIFEQDCNGFKKGDIEYPKVVKEEDGIRFRVYGLSPIMLAYGEEDAVVDTSKNGLSVDEEGIWAYYVNGAIDVTFTGLVQNEAGWWYVRDGYLDWAYTGLASNDAGTWYVENGGINFAYTDLFCAADGWYYVMEGRVPTEYTGLVRNSEGLWYVENGIINWNHTGLVNSAEGWYYVLDGRVTEEYTGLVSNEEGMWYVSGGILDWGHTALVSSVEGWYYVMDGRVTVEYTGLVSNEEGTWYIAEGKLDWEHTGLVSSLTGWWYVLDGRVTEEYVGLVENENGVWYVQNGSISFAHTGLVSDITGWWYVINSEVATDYTGLATNENGTWYVQNGYLDFGFSGNVTIGENTYIVVGGMVQ